MNKITLSSSFTGWEECPKCHVTGKKAVLARYSDGHAFCYYCGYHESRNKIPLDLSNDTEKEFVIRIPLDSKRELPVMAMQWLNKYDITRQEVIDNDIMWSEVRQQLVFPYYGADNKLIAWQGRDFSPNAKSKWFSQGDLKSIIHVLGEWASPVVVVEDIVSAIKVSRQCACMALFGSHVQAEQFARLANYFDEIIVWFDPDAKLKAFKSARLAQELGLKARSIVSSKDPKEHTDEEVKDYLR